MLYVDNKNVLVKIRAIKTKKFLSVSSKEDFLEGNAQKMRNVFLYGQQNAGQYYIISMVNQFLENVTKLTQFGMALTNKNAYVKRLGAV
jgi:hypothetical protein